ncbi:MAG: efflux RND transporter permease subunit, partial [Gimesia chilikensis]
LFGVQLEQMSLASMIISLGLLVDNAVQICDQSRTNQIEGMGPIEASVSGARMLAAPMLNGTLTTIASFVPMVIFFEGGNREFIYSLPVTLSVMLAVSWVLAMTFCVILAAMFIRPPKSKDQPSAPLVRCFYWFKGLFRRKRPADDFSWKSENQHFISRIYGALVSQAIKHKFLTLGVSIGLFFLALKLPVSTEFFPQGERDQFVVGVWLPENVSIEQTNQAARQVEELLRKLSPTTDEVGNQVERLRAMRTLVGGGGSRWYLSWNPESRKAN